MKTSFLRLMGCTVLLITVAFRADNASAREWTDITGAFRIEAELVEYKDGVVRLRKTDGSIVSVPLAKLSKADQNYVLKPDSLAAQARDVLNKTCHSCHGEDGSDEGGMNYVLKWSTLAIEHRRRLPVADS